MDSKMVERLGSEREVSLMASSLLAAPTSGFENDSGKV
jgi:hypothetical protein